MTAAGVVPRWNGLMRMLFFHGTEILMVPLSAALLSFCLWLGCVMQTIDSLVFARQLCLGIFSSCVLLTHPRAFLVVVDNDVAIALGCCCVTAFVLCPIAPPV